MVLQIHTLEARDNVLLEVVLEQPDQSPKEIRSEIAHAVSVTTQQLKERKISYESLRTALTPQVDKRELALLFNSAVMDGFYGKQAAESILPHLRRNGSHSILTGDVLIKNQEVFFQALDKEATIWGDPPIYHSGQIYVVYLTNLTDNDLIRLIQNVKDSIGAMGYVDCTYNSLLKTILSMSVSAAYVKHENRFITRHPADCPPGTNLNTGYWQVEDCGYSVASIEDTYFDLFLNYKIESTLPGSAFNDGHFSIAAVAGIWTDPRSLTISVDDAKRAYLADNKSGSLTKAGLSDMTASELATKISEKIGSSYIYSLVWNETLDYSNFAAMVEFEAGGRIVRLRAVLKYEDGQLGLVSLFG